MRLLTNALAILPLLAALVGCAATGNRSGPTAASLAGSSWRCLAIEGETIAAADAPTLRFEADGRIGGSGGVNRYGAEIRIDGPSIAIGPIMSTKMAAEPARMDLESRYFDALRQATRLERRGDTLEFLAGDRPLPLLRFGLADEGDR